MNLLVSVENGVGNLVLNRPETHNAVSKAMWQSLPSRLEELKEKGASVVVLSGSGSAFAAGADLSELKCIDSYESASQLWSAISFALEFLWSFSLPTIAKINGPCLGGGLLLAMACDLRYASVNSTFGIPTARLGIILDDSNIARLVQLVLPGKAKELLFLGTLVSATKAEAIGLINAVVEAENLDGLVKAVTEKIIHNSIKSILRAKESVNKAQLLNSRTKTKDLREVIESYIGEDFKERIVSHRSLD